MAFSKSPSLWTLVLGCALVVVQASCSSDESAKPIEDSVMTSGIGGTSLPNVGITAGANGAITPNLDGSVSGSDGGGVTLLSGSRQCGNGIIESGENCEPSIPIRTTCEALSRGTGTPTCSPSCVFDFRGCSAGSTNGSDNSAARFTVNFEISSAIGTVGIVTWSTDLNPVDEAHIDFGLDQTYGMKAPVDLKEPRYRTLLLGMKGSKDYHFRVVANSGGKEYKSDDYVLTTGPVTNLVRITNLNVTNEAARARGFIVSSLFQSGPDIWANNTGDFSSAALAFIADADGDIVWWYKPTLSSTTRARMSYDGKYMWMVTVGQSFGGSVSNGIERISMDGLDAKTFSTPATHDITAVSGNVMAFPSGGFIGCVVMTEITPDGTTTPIFDTNQIWAGGMCHANAIRFSETENLYTLSDLDQGDVIMVDRATKTVVNKLSEFSFDWGRHQHGHHLLDNSILIFNNDLAAIQEISLDRTTMQSAEIWRYSSEFSSRVLGDVQRLPNGNTWITYSTAARIHEVAPDGTLITEIQVSQPTGYSVWRKSLYGPPPDIKQ